MPQELTPEQRLTQIEQILKSAVKLSHSNTAKIDANTELIKVNEEFKVLLLTVQTICSRAIALRP